VRTDVAVNPRLHCESNLELLLYDFRGKSGLLDTSIIFLRRAGPQEHHRQGIITIRKYQSKIGGFAR